MHTGGLGLMVSNKVLSLNESVSYEFIILHSNENMDISCEMYL